MARRKSSGEGCATLILIGAVIYAVMYWYVSIPVVIVGWLCWKAWKERTPGPAPKGRFANDEYIRQLQEIDRKKQTNNGAHYAPPKESTQQQTVCYIIIKNGLGKFGITKKRDRNERAAVRNRYNNEPLTILWTTTVSSRGQAFDFEEYCKSRVKVLAAREWFHESEASRLVKDVTAAGY